MERLVMLVISLKIAGWTIEALQKDGSSLALYTTSVDPDAAVQYCQVKFNSFYVFINEQKREHL